MNKMSEKRTIKIFLNNLAKITASMHAVKWYEMEKRKAFIGCISAPAPPHIFECNRCI